MSFVDSLRRADLDLLRNLRIAVKLLEFSRYYYITGIILGFFSAFTFSTLSVISSKLQPNELRGL